MLCLVGCGWVTERTKGALNKGGELAGSAATEVIEGVATGVEQTWKVQVLLSKDLSEHGLILGKTLVESGDDGRNNKLIIFLSSDQAFQDTVMAVAYGQDGLEMGRAPVLIGLKAGHGAHHTVQFEPYTDLERKGRVELRWPAQK